MGQYYISQNGQQIGPLELHEIVASIRKNKISLLDYIYDDKKNDWTVLMEFEPVALQVKDHRPPPPLSRGPVEFPPPIGNQSTKVNHPTVAIPAVNHDSETAWFILKGENKFGPFAFSDLIKMLQKKSLFEYDFIWNASLSSWRRVAETDDFKPENIKKLASSNQGNMKEIFFRRRHRRMNYNGTLLVHDNKVVWKGRGLEISAGGVGVIMENAMLNPGQILFLHFKPCDGVPPFNATCEIVNKQFVEGIKNKNTPVRYGLKFTNINSSTQQALHDLAHKSGAA